jgi:hypothetical protein
VAVHLYGDHPGPRPPGHPGHPADARRCRRVAGAAAGHVRQERSPAHLLPRVVELSTASIPVVAPIGVLGTGFLIDGLGLHRTLLLMTAGAVLIGTTVMTSHGVRVLDGTDLDQPEQAQDGARRRGTVAG